MKSGVILLAISLLAGGWACRARQASVAGQTGVSSALLSWRDSERMVYRVSLSSSMQPAADTSPVTIALSGQLELRTRVASPMVHLLANLTNVSLQASGEGGKTAPVDVMRELQQPWGFDLEKGRLHQVHTAGSSSAITRSILTTLAATFQSPSVADQKDPVTAHELDGTGRYQARYTRGSEPGTYGKSKLSYEKVALNPTALGKGGMDLVPKVVASKGELRISEGRLVGSKNHDEIAVELGSGNPLRSQTDLELTLVEQGAASPAPDWDGLLAATIAVTPGQRQLKEVNKPNPAFDDQRIRGLTFEQALAELEKEKPSPVKADAGAPPPSEVRAFSAMAAILRTQPQSLPKALAAVKTRPASQMALLDALGAAGTAQTMAALAQLAEDRKLPENVRQAAAYALLRTPQPNAASVDRMIGWLKDELLKPYALSGLGTFSRKLREEGATEASTRAAEALVRVLQAPAWHAWRVEVLRGIANSGYGKALTQVRPLLEDKEDSIRAAAIDAIRLMPNAEVDALVAAHLGPEEKMIVRMAALDAAGLRTPNRVLVDALGNAAANAPDVHGRIRAIRLAQRWLPQYPEMRKVLEKIARDDSRAEVREAAAVALKA
jgi:hypothetical protein